LQKSTPCFPGDPPGQVNVSIYKEVEAVVGRVVKTFGKLDIIFNNAGIAGGKPLGSHPEVDYMPTIRVDQTVSTRHLAAGRQFRDQALVASSSAPPPSMASRRRAGLLHSAAKQLFCSLFSRYELAEYVRAVAILAWEPDHQPVQ
jgi:NAD(P)-dependent dehydrogenase (short-subunit alcohol dehydrogenase family)